MEWGCMKIIERMKEIKVGNCFLRVNGGEESNFGKSCVKIKPYKKGMVFSLLLTVLEEGDGIS